MNWACCLTRSPALGAMQPAPGQPSDFSRSPSSSVSYKIFSAFTMNSGCSMQKKKKKKKITQFFLVRKHEMTLKEPVPDQR